MKQTDNTNLELDNDKSDDTGDSTLSSNFKEQDADYQQEVLLQGQAC